MKKHVVWIFPALILYMGCKSFEPNPDNLLLFNLPSNFSLQLGKTKDEINYIQQEKWWFYFDSKELNSLIEKALKDNFDIKILKARIKQAKAQTQQAKALFFPNLGFSFSGFKQRKQSKNYNEDIVRNTSNSWDTGLTGSYNPDVFGRTKASAQTNLLRHKAAEFDLQTLIYNLIDEIVKTWIDIVAVQNKIKILKKQIKANRTLLKLQKLRFVNGKANALDVSEQKEALSRTKSFMPLLIKQRKLLLNSLGFLTGSTDIVHIKISKDKMPNFLPFLDTGLPMQLLENRSDIKAAQARLLSSQWEVTIAKTDLLPSFEISTKALFSNGSLNLLFQNWITSLGASINATIFDAGLKKSKENKIKAYVNELLNFYAKTVAKAIFEVENNLINLQEQKTYIDLLKQELQTSKLRLENAQIQYLNGKTNYLSYILALTNIENLERQLIEQKAVYIKYQINLYRTLGIQSFKKQE